MNLEKLLKDSEVIINYNNSAYRLEEVKKTPTILFHMDLKGEVSFINQDEESKRIIAGYASIAVVDLEEQIIPVEVLKAGIQTLLDDPHYANLMLVHKNIQIGKIIEAYGDITTHVDEEGLFIVCEIRKDIKVAEEIWSSILEGELNGFSIGCEVLLSHDECDAEKCITVLDQINIFEISICTSPINKGSGFIVISKAKYNEELSVDECPCLNKDGNMTKKTKAKTPKVEKTLEKPTEPAKETTEEKSDEVVQEEKSTEEKATVEEIDVSFKDRLDNLERAVNSLVETLQQSQTEEKQDEEDDDIENDEDDDYEEGEEKSKPKESEEKESEEKAAPWGSMDPDNQSSPANPTIIDPHSYPVIKSSIEELSKKVDTILEKLSKDAEVEELNLAMKARDDKISELEKRVEIVNKSISDETEEKVIVEQKTKASEEEDEEIIDITPISDIVIKGGYITRPL